MPLTLFITDNDECFCSFLFAFEVLDAPKSWKEEEEEEEEEDRPLLPLLLQPLVQPRASAEAVFS